MHTTESFDCSLGLESFRTPSKFTQNETITTNPSNTSLEYSKFTQPHSIAHFTTISKFLSEDQRLFSPVLEPQSSKNIGRQQENPEDRLQQLVNMQRCFLPLYHKMRDQAQSCRALEKEINYLKTSNLLKKNQLKFQKQSIRNLVNRWKVQKQRMKRREMMFYDEIEDEIRGSKDRITQLEIEINQLRKQVSKKRYKKEKRNYYPPPPPIILMHGGPRPPSTHLPTQQSRTAPFEIHGAHPNPPPPLSNSQPLIRPPSQLSQHEFLPPHLNSPGGAVPNFSFGDVLTKALLQKMSGTQGNKKKQMKSSTSWENGHEEKEIIEIMSQSKKESMNKKADANQNLNLMALFGKKLQTPKGKSQKVEQSNINISVAESRISGASIQKKKKPEPKFRQSSIRVDVPDDDSNSKSYRSEQFQMKQNSSAEYSPTFNMNFDTPNPPPKTQFNLNSRMKRVTEEDEEPETMNIPPKNIKISNRSRRQKSGDVVVTDLMVDRDNLKESQAYSITKKKDAPLIHQYQSETLEREASKKKQTEEAEEDDDDIFSINLMAVSKISKERQISEKGLNFSSSGDKEEPRESRSNIVSKGKRNSAQRTADARKMSKIIEDDLEAYEEKEERRRKGSGNYSNIYEEDQSARSKRNEWGQRSSPVMQ